MTSPASPLRLPGFEYGRMDVDGVVINHAIAGSGPPLLLLHVRGTALPTGHFLPEEAPGLVTAALRDFLG